MEILALLHSSHVMNSRMLLLNHEEEDRKSLEDDGAECFIMTPQLQNCAFYHNFTIISTKFVAHL